VIFNASPSKLNCFQLGQLSLSALITPIIIQFDNRFLGTFTLMVAVKLIESAAFNCLQAQETVGFDKK